MAGYNRLIQKIPLLVFLHYDKVLYNVRYDKVVLNVKAVPEIILCYLAIFS